MLYTCTPHAAHAPADDHGAAPVSNGSKSYTVDIHCHASSAAVAKKMQAERDRVGIQALGGGNERTRQVNLDQIATIEAKMSSVEQRLADMDKSGVDIQALSVPPYQYFYWADPDLGREASVQLNDHIAGIVAAHPGSLCRPRHGAPAEHGAGHRRAGTLRQRAGIQRRRDIDPYQRRTDFGAAAGEILSAGRRTWRDDLHSPRSFHPPGSG